jgi:hypothetical protein
MHATPESSIRTCLLKLKDLQDKEFKRVRITDVFYPKKLHNIRYTLLMQSKMFLNSIILII